MQGVPGVSLMRPTKKKLPTSYSRPDPTLFPELPEVRKLTIEAVLNISPNQICSACFGPAPIAVKISGARSQGKEGCFVLCHPCADRIGGQSGRLSAIVRDQLDDQMFRKTESR